MGSYSMCVCVFVQVYVRPVGNVCNTDMEKSFNRINLPLSGL